MTTQVIYYRDTQFRMRLNLVATSVFKYSCPEKNFYLQTRVVIPSKIKVHLRKCITHLLEFLHGLIFNVKNMIVHRKVGSVVAEDIFSLEHLH